MPEDRTADPKPTKSIPKLGGWGRFPVTETVAVRPEKNRDLYPVGSHCLARGMGRSYGDAALLTGGTVVMTEKLDRFIEFDEDSGTLRSEAGATLKDVLDTFVPRGWFVPVTPGTKHCTLGGCVAADVHGKNHHHEGTFSRHVERLVVVLADGSRISCGPSENAGLFWATVGGMGLTGLISEVTLRLTPVETALMKVKHTKSANLDQTVDLLTDARYDARYTVAWLDCLAKGARLGRGVLMAGDHALKSEVSLRIQDPLVTRAKRAKPFPFEFPGWVLNPMTIKAFNALYYAYQGRRKEFVCGYDEYFYPLDGIDSWYRMYGKRGFVQYQYVMPTETARQGTREVLTLLSGEKKASFLAVLKRFGPQGQGLLSFPMEGLTLALDIPMSDELLPFLDRLDEIVLKYKGRIYLAKDSRMEPEVFKAGYPRIDEFCRTRAQFDPEGRFDSDMARRLKLCQ